MSNSGSWNIDIGSGERSKPITLQQVLCAVLGIFIFITFFPAISPAVTGSSKVLARVLLFLEVGLFILCLWWHFWAHSPKRNTVPDVLIWCFNPKEVYDGGGLHLAFDIIQLNQCLFLQIITQNIYDAIIDFKLNIEVEGIRTTFNVPRLSQQITNSGVIKSMIALPISKMLPVKPDKTISFKFNASVIPHGRKKTRFSRRQVLDKKSKPWLFWLTLLIGKTIIYEPAWTFIFQIVSYENKQDLVCNMKWQTIELWSPMNNRTEIEVQDLVETIL